MTQQQQGKGQSGGRFNLDDYRTVAERVGLFWAKYPLGRIETSIVEHDLDGGRIVMRTEVYRDADAERPAATGTACEIRSSGYVNGTSYVENCETSSVGRALALLGFHPDRTLATREEAERAAAGEGEQARPVEAAAPEAGEQAGGAGGAAEAEVETKGEGSSLGFVRSVLSELNKIGDEFTVDGRNYTEWTARSLDAFVNKRYEVKAGIKDLDDPKRVDLQKHLAARLASVKKSKSKGEKK